MGGRVVLICNIGRNKNNQEQAQEHLLKMKEIKGKIV
jgi:hypothetical protein